jgi:putative membrane protein
MIDYVTLMLVNMIAGLVVLALFLWWGFGCEDRRHWAPALALPGVVATVSGFAMASTWPIPEPYSMAFGEMSVFFGVLFLGAAWALACRWSLVPLGIYAFFPGAAAILLGVRLIDLSLTRMPWLSGIGFVVTGVGGLFAGVTLLLGRYKVLRIAGGLVMLAAAALWVPTGYIAYWDHMKVKQSQPQEQQNAKTDSLDESKSEAGSGGE